MLLVSMVFLLHRSKLLPEKKGKPDIPSFSEVCFIPLMTEQTPCRTSVLKQRIFSIQKKNKKNVVRDLGLYEITLPYHLKFPVD